MSDRAETQDDQRRPMVRIQPMTIMMVALIFFISSWYTSERPLVLIAVPMLFWLFVRNIKSPVPQPAARLVMIAALALLVYDMFNPRITGQGQPDLDAIDNYARMMNGVWIVIGAVVFSRVRSSRQTGVGWHVAILISAALVGAATILVTPEPEIDVWHLHQEAGNALFDGLNPYADIEVVASGKVGEEALVMTGYPYTPPNLAVFGTSAVATGDSRWFSLASWLGFLAIFSGLRPRTNAATALLFLVASQPAWQIILEISYTESVTLLCVAGALALWRGRRWLGPALLGVALSTKQYLVVLAPMVIGARIISVRDRVVTLAAAAVAVGVGVIWGVSEYVDAVLLYHLRVLPQDHSVNLYGIIRFFEGTWVPPAALGIAASVIVGLISARTAKNTSQILIGAASALGIGFFLAAQAFVNYWFLVGVLLTMALLYAESDTSDATAAPESPDATKAERTVAPDSR